MNQYQLVTDYWVEFILLVIILGHLLEHLIPLVIEGVKKLDHKEQEKVKKVNKPKTPQK